MRALLILNPRATSMTGPAAGQVVRELGKVLELRTAQTRYRGHAHDLAAKAAARGFDLVITFGGDGTINEVVNGLMRPAAGGDAGRGGDSAGDATGKAEDTAEQAATSGKATAAAREAAAADARNPDGQRAQARRSAMVSRPALAMIPGGGGNVLARTLGVPIDPAAAARDIVATIRREAPASAGAAASAATRAASTMAGRTRPAPATTAARRAGRKGQPAGGRQAAARLIGLGLASSPGLAEERYFTFSAGLGLDAEVVADVERARAEGQQSSPLLYMRTALRRYYTATDRAKPALTLHRPGEAPLGGLFMGVVTNSSPWTYVGSLPVLPVPHADGGGSLNSGLDLFALRRLRTLSTLSALYQMMHSASSATAGPDMLTCAELTALTFSADRPIAFHIDGEYLGEAETVSFSFVPDALRVIA